MVAFRGHVFAEPGKQAVKAGEENEKARVQKINPAAITTYYAEGSKRVNALVERWKIKSLREFNETASDKDINTFNEEFVFLQKEILDTGYKKLFAEGGLYTHPGGCAFLVTDMVSLPPEGMEWSDEPGQGDRGDFESERSGNAGENLPENSGKETAPEAVSNTTSLTVALVCQNTAGEKSAGLTFVLTVSPRLSEKLSNMDFTIVGEVDPSMYKTPDEYRQYLADGLLEGLVLKVESYLGNTAFWEPHLLIDPEAQGTPMPDYGAMTVFGSLVETGTRLKAEQVPGNGDVR